MPMLQLCQGSPRDAKVRLLSRGGLRRSAVVLGAIGLTAGAGLLSAGSALASNGSQPGNLLLHPSSGASSLKPTFSTTDGCPAGHQGSAQIVEFNPSGTFGSRISIVVPSPTTAFRGTLAGDVAQLLALGTNAKPGQTSEWAMGCYSQIAGTGSVEYVQCTFVTLAADGKSYTSSSGGGRPASPSSSSAPSGQAASATATATSATGPPVGAAAIAGACGLAVAVTGLTIYRRRNRNRLQ